MAGMRTHLKGLSSHVCVPGYCFSKPRNTCPASGNQIVFESIICHSKAPNRPRPLWIAIRILGPGSLFADKLKGQEPDRRVRGQRGLQVRQLDGLRAGLGLAQRRKRGTGAPERHGVEDRRREVQERESSSRAWPGRYDGHELRVRLHARWPPARRNGGHRAAEGFPGS
jgi:hypothetical protein